MPSPHSPIIRPRPNLVAVLQGCADDLEAFANDPGIVLAVADRLRRYVANELAQ
jgi:hypothetical protein